MRHILSAVVSILASVIGFGGAILWYSHVITESNEGHLTSGAKLVSIIAIVICLVLFLAIALKIAKKIDPKGITFRSK